MAATKGRFLISSSIRKIGLRTVPTIVTAHFSAHAKVVARGAKEMRNTQDTRSGFVSCKSGRFYLFLVEKMRRFSTDEK